MGALIGYRFGPRNDTTPLLDQLIDPPGRDEIHRARPPKLPARQNEVACWCIAESGATLPTSTADPTTAIPRRPPLEPYQAFQLMSCFSFLCFPQSFHSFFAWIYIRSFGRAGRSFLYSLSFIAFLSYTIIPRCGRCHSLRHSCAVHFPIQLVEFSRFIPTDSTPLTDSSRPRFTVLLAGTISARPAGFQLGIYHPPKYWKEVCSKFTSLELQVEHDGSGRGPTTAAPIGPASNACLSYG
jgi:hypothetical protein